MGLTRVLRDSMQCVLPPASLKKAVVPPRAALEGQVREIMIVGKQTSALAFIVAGQHDGDDRLACPRPRALQELDRLVFCEVLK
jgi:hypothetical protein